MKKLIIILLLLTSLIFISGCRNKNKTIDYMVIVEIPSLIEVDIEDVPDNLNTFIKVTDEINVVKVSVDTSKVNFDTPGDYSIIITVDYYDGVSKEFNSVLRLAFNDSIGVPVILGIKNRLLSPTSDEIDFLEGVAFSDNGKIIDSGVIGNVNLNTEGIYTLIYYAEDDDGNKAKPKADVKKETLDESHAKWSDVEKYMKTASADITKVTDKYIVSDELIKKLTN